MKRILSVLICVLGFGVVPAALGATPLYFRDIQTLNKLAPDQASARSLSETNGSAPKTFIKGTVPGPVTPPTSGTQFTISNGGSRTSWTSEPFAGDTVLSGPITVAVRAKVSSSSAFAALTARVVRVNGAGTAVLGTVAPIQVDRPALGTSFSAQTISLTAGAGVTVLLGERVGVQFFVDDSVGAVQASGFTVTLEFNDVNALVTFGQAIVFASYSSTPTLTHTPVIPAGSTATATRTVTPTATISATSTASPTVTPTATPTVTSTSTRTSTPDSHARRPNQRLSLGTNTDSTVCSNNGSITVTDVGNRIHLVSAWVRTTTGTAHTLTFFENGCVSAIRTVTLDADVFPCHDVTFGGGTLDPDSTFNIGTSVDVAGADTVDVEYYETTAGGELVWP